MPDKKYIIAALAVAVIGVVLVTKYVKISAGPLDSFSPRVQAAYEDTFNRLEFPPGANETYQRQVAGFLAGCLDSCLSRKMDFYGQRLTLKNCRPGCACIANTRMASEPVDFIGGKRQSPQEQVDEIKHCLVPASQK